LNRTLRVILALTLPATAILALVIHPLVGIFDFEAADTARVVWTARALLLGLAGHSILELASRAFYARQDARTPLLAAGFMVVLFIILAVLLARPLGAPGIGLANAIAFTSQALLLLFLLNRRIPGLVRVDGMLLRVVLVSVAGGLLVYGLMRLPLPGIPLAAASLAVGMAAILPFIWPEVRLLLRL
jgi:putative peptidoglycan lipid II flippase